MDTAAEHVQLRGLVASGQRLCILVALEDCQAVTDYALCSSDQRI